MRQTHPRILLSLLLPIATVLSVVPTTTPAVAADTANACGALTAPMNAALASANKRAAELQGQIDEVNGKIAGLESKLEAQRAEKAQLVSNYSQLLRTDYIYMSRDTSGVEVAVSDSTLSDLAAKQKYPEMFADQINRQYDEIQRLSADMEKELKDLQKQRDGLQAMLGDLEQERTTAQQQQDSLDAAAKMSHDECVQAAAAAKAAEVTPATQAAAPSSAPSPGSGSGGGSVSGYSGGNNPYPYGQCTWYAYNATGRGQNGNAGTWRPTSSTPGVGKIMIWSPGEQGASGAGHVGVVIGVSGNTVTIRHMNWRGVGVVSVETFRSTGKFY